MPLIYAIDAFHAAFITLIFTPCHIAMFDTLPRSPLYYRCCYDDTRRLLRHCRHAMLLPHADAAAMPRDAIFGR